MNGNYILQTDAKIEAGLNPMGVDHGTVQFGLGIVLYEFGLLEPMNHYFILNRTLYAGNAVLYAYDEHGETIDAPEDLRGFKIKFLHGIDAVETALQCGEVNRPYTAINGVKLAEWRNGSLQTIGERK